MTKQKKSWLKRLWQKYNQFYEEAGLEGRHCGCMPVVRADKNGNKIPDKAPVEMKNCDENHKFPNKV
ncbi:hypothetical protein CFY87_07180 [Actinobacillus seminis]|uniref:Uncharacterized protein n=1 Tax=Actinobacillus seminis TaxID=722 RepID=A0A263HBC5_9PAST|nr:DUF5363 family protein [Actinobacillus seminis]OZN24763.1 hypothetical protein CFY87_07180 [Actinobacillus seminis]SUU35203.1 Uncharacterised protein [Actinobacillus seminis]